MSVVKANQSNYPSQSQQTQITQWSNQNSRQIHVTGAKLGKTRASESGLVWVLLLIGGENGAIFFNQSQREVKQTIAKRELLDTQLKTPLLCRLIPDVDVEIQAGGLSRVSSLSRINILQSEANISRGVTSTEFLSDAPSDNNSTGSSTVVPG